MRSLAARCASPPDKIRYLLKLLCHSSMPGEIHRNITFHNVEIYILFIFFTIYCIYVNTAKGDRTYYLGISVQGGDELFSSEPLVIALPHRCDLCLLL